MLHCVCAPRPRRDAVAFFFSAAGPSQDARPAKNGRRARVPGSGGGRGSGRGSRTAKGFGLGLVLGSTGDKNGGQAARSGASELLLGAAGLVVARLQAGALVRRGLCAGLAQQPLLLLLKGVPLRSGEGAAEEGR
jgi:hypothetical protein